MKTNETVGIDISKLTLDAHLYCSKLSKSFNNNKTGFKKLIQWCEKNSGTSIHKILICFEHTGLYSYRLATFLSELEIKFCMVPGLEVKKSIGMKRGKNDVVDAQRIAEYAYLRRETIQPYKIPCKNIQKFQNLLTVRDKMVRQKAGFKVDLSELKTVITRKSNEVLFNSQEKIILQLSKQIEKLETEIKLIVSSDQQLLKTFKLATSVTGIGLILAANLLVTTNAFTAFTDSRKFACYAGVAPFDFQSGTSMRRSKKINHMANKKMKALLQIAALSAIRHDPEMRTYYDRRIQEGKHKMSTLNIVRNKVLHRVFAVVKRGTPYVPLCQHSK